MLVAEQCWCGVSHCILGILGCTRGEYQGGRGRLPDFRVYKGSGPLSSRVYQRGRRRVEESFFCR